ncbi:MAG TPA: ABC transporter ATP-binding protein [Candidatus Eremiobacteraceae bacterium]
MTAAVRAQGLRLDYGPRGVFDRVDIALYPGMLTAVVGPNGAGKSSLLRLLAGVQPPTAGTIERTARVMLIASDSAPPPDVTPRDLAGYGLALRRPWYRFAPGPEDESAINSGLDRAGLADRADDPIGSLSAGEVQRAWIAAALATTPAALLVDEPTSHLDLRYQIEVLRTLRDLADSGVAVAVAVHDLTLAARFADRAALFTDGTLIEGPPEQIFLPDALERAYGIAVTTHRHPVDGYLVCLPSDNYRSISK